MGTLRIKELRKLQGLTQIDLAAKLGVSLSSIAMWETGKRIPGFKSLNTMSELFDKSIEYILGESDDDRSVKLSDKKTDQLGEWQMDDSYSKLVKEYLLLDDYGRATVETVLQMEKLRCINQHTIVTKSEEE